MKRKRESTSLQGSTDTGRARDYAPVRASGWLRWERVKRLLIALVAAILLTALQTTLLGRLPLPFGSVATPSLTLLLTLVAGFFLGERTGAVMGLLAGFFADAAGGEGVMILPLLYTLCGYLVGWLARDHLARNLPSFLVWAVVAGIWEQGVRYAVAAVTARTLPPGAMIGQVLLPDLIVTLLLAPLMYGAAKLLMKLFVR